MVQQSTVATSAVRPNEPARQVIATFDNYADAERRSRVTFDVEPDGDVVKLIVMHDQFEPGSTVLGMISGGWPRVASPIYSTPHRTRWS